ncbi:hypothetical protein JCM6882_000312 [Rhodosporidiobolus microsporus]
MAQPPHPESADRPPHPSPPPRHISSVATPITEREHRLSGASEARNPPRGRRASSPPAGTRPSRLRESISRFDSSNSSFPSIAQSSTRQSTNSDRPSSADRPPASRPRQQQQKQQPQQPKKRRARPPNLAGPAPVERIRAIPDNLNDRTPGSESSQHAPSFYASSGSGQDEGKEGGRNGGGKPLFAMGGVFPKHAPKRRRSSMAKEWERQEEERQGRGRSWRAELPPSDGQGYASSGALNTNSSAGDYDTAASARDCSAGVNERTDPFEDLERPPSKSSPKPPLEVVVSHDEPEDREEAKQMAAALKDEIAVDEEEEGRNGDSTEEAEEGDNDLEKRHSSSSATVAEEEEGGGQKGAQGYEGEEQGEKFGHRESQQEGRTRPKDGGEQPAIGGELNQDTEDWEHDLERDENDPDIRNWWGTIRYTLREPLAEFLGTMVLIVIGIGSDCQTKISENAMGDYQSMNWSWGFAVMTSIYIAGGVSGGHTNPSVTIVLALFRGFPWKLVPRYIIAQIAGAFCGALIIYGNYRRAIIEYDGEKNIVATATANASAPLFITAPATQVGGTVEGFCQEVLASGILTIAVLALGDENNAPPGAGLGAIVLGFIVVAIGMSNGWISGYAINIARDLGPRLALWSLGYGVKLWHHNDWWWLSGAICGPIVGGIAGAFAYDACIFTGPGSPVNYSGHEIIEACGIPRMHNMVRMVVDPRYRKRRLSASRTQDPEQLAETGMAPASLVQQQTRRVPPGRMAPDEVDEMVAVSRRWRRGKQKVVREAEASRRRQERETREWRRSIEELRERERERPDPAEEEREEKERQQRKLRPTQSAL